jgi:magnesium transporter
VSAQDAHPADSTATTTVARCLHNPGHDEVDAHLDDGKFFWLDLESPSTEDIKRLADRLHLHPLTVEDALTFRQRPKREEYDGYTYLVVYGVDPAPDPGRSLLREVHLIISSGCVVTIHRRPLEVLSELRERNHDQPVRSQQFLIYKILDAVLGTFVPVLARTDDEIDDLEESVLSKPDQQRLQEIFSLKRDLIAMRRVVTPMRDFFARDEDRITHLPGMPTDEHLYFRDLYDSLIRTSDLIDSYRDLLSGATDMYLSTVANRQGEIAKQLTIIATIFLPLSFLTGFFGQNFSFLTNHILDNTWTFFALGLGGLVVSIGVLWWFFRRKGWLGETQG